MVWGYIACFFAGAAVCIAAAFLCRFWMPEGHEERRIEGQTDRQAEKLREQWENLLNYDGSPGNGGM